MKSFFLFLILLTVFFSSGVHSSLFAAGPAVGLPRDLIWFSSDSFVEGDQISVFTTIFNSTPDRFSGKATLSDGGATIGTQEFSVPPDGATIVLSFPWKATKGEHAFSVKILNGTFATGNGKFSDIPSMDTSTAKVTRLVPAKSTATTVPPLAPGVADVESGEETSAPSPIEQVKARGLPVLGAVETFRESQTSKNEERINTIKGQLESEGLPAGIIDAVLLTTSKEGWAQLGSGRSGGELLRTPWEYVKLFLLYCYQFVVSHPYIFYVVLLLVIYKIIRAIIGLVI